MVNKLILEIFTKPVVNFNIKLDFECNFDNHRKIYLKTERLAGDSCL